MPEKIVVALNEEQGLCSFWCQPQRQEKITSLSGEMWAGHKDISAQDLLYQRW